MAFWELSFSHVFEETEVVGDGSVPVFSGEDVGGNGLALFVGIAALGDDGHPERKRVRAESGFRIKWGGSGTTVTAPSPLLQHLALLLYLFLGQETNVSQPLLDKLNSAIVQEFERLRGVRRLGRLPA